MSLILSSTLFYAFNPLSVLPLTKRRSGRQLTPNKESSRFERSTQIYCRPLFVLSSFFTVIQQKSWEFFKNSQDFCSFFLYSFDLCMSEFFKIFVAHIVLSFCYTFPAICDFYHIVFVVSPFLVLLSPQTDAFHMHSLDDFQNIFLQSYCIPAIF